MCVKTKGVLVIKESLRKGLRVLFLSREEGQYTKVLLSCVRVSLAITSLEEIRKDDS